MRKANLRGTWRTSLLRHGYLSLSLATLLMAPALALAAESDRLTVEDPSTGALMFRVTSAGNVSAAKANLTQIGINTTTPTSQIEVAADGGPNSEVKLRVASSGNGVPTFYGTRAGGSLGTPAATPAGKGLFWLGSTGYGASGWTSALSGLIAFHASETWSDTAMGTEIRIATTTKGTNTRTERLRITDNGSVGIGTTTPSQKLEVAGTVKATAFVGDGSQLTNLPANTSLPGSKPACSTTTRGVFWVTQGATGVGATKDTVEVCTKDQYDVYSWRTLW